MVLHGRFPYLSTPGAIAAKTTLLWKSTDLGRRRFPGVRSTPRAERRTAAKVYLAMALAQDTDTILMDEPTTYLDVRHQLEVMTTARRLAEEGKAVVLVLHDLCLALPWVDEVAVLSGQAAPVGYAGGNLRQRDPGPGHGSNAPKDPDGGRLAILLPVPKRRNARRIRPWDISLLHRHRRKTGLIVGGGTVAPAQGGKAIALFPSAHRGCAEDLTGVGGPSWGDGSLPPIFS